MRNLAMLDLIMLVILVIGGLNWGLIGIANFDLVAFIFGAGSSLSKIVYSFVGLAAVYTLYIIYKLKML